MRLKGFSERRTESCRCTRGHGLALGTQHRRRIGRNFISKMRIGRDRRIQDLRYGVAFELTTTQFNGLADSNRMLKLDVYTSWLDRRVSVQPDLSYLEIGRVVSALWVCLPRQSVAYYARQCFCFLDPVLDRVDARYFVHMFLLAVNSRLSGGSHLHIVDEGSGKRKSSKG